MKKKVKLTLLESVNSVLDSSDIILCVLDARFIEETRNYEIEKKIKEMNKKMIYVVNKSDLTGGIGQKELSNLYPNVVVVSCTKRIGVNELRNKIRMLAKQIKKESSVFIGVIGYPNTGKSSVINLVLGRKEIAKTSPVPGFTKGVQKLKLATNLYLLDSPGIIPADERFANLTKLAMIGVKSFDMAKDPDLVVYDLMQKHPLLFEGFYHIDAAGDSEKLIEILGRRRNILMKKGKIDVDRVSRMILRDWQKGYIKAK